MVVDYSKSFSYSGQVVYPAKNGNKSGYVLALKPYDLFEWQDLEAVTKYFRDKGMG